MLLLDRRRPLLARLLALLAASEGALALLGACSVGASPPPHWVRIEPPASWWTATELFIYITLNTGALLCFIRGVKYVRASTAAVLGSLEIVFSSLIGAVVLRQPTNALAVCGNALVFFGTALVAQGAAREPQPPPPVFCPLVVELEKLKFSNFLGRNMSKVSGTWAEGFPIHFSISSACPASLSKMKGLLNEENRHFSKPQISRI